MRISVHAVGKLKAGPEQELAERYFDRLRKTGPAIGLEYSGTIEHLESRAQTAAERKLDEASRLSARLAGADMIVLDERGKNLSSEELAAHVGRVRDDGWRDLALVIGGPDGFDPAFRDTAGLVLSFGKATWPHQMVRVMLAEQLYRVTTILSGHPYHRA